LNIADRFSASKGSAAEPLRVNRPPSGPKVFAAVAEKIKNQNPDKNESEPARMVLSKRAILKGPRTTKINSVRPSVGLRCPWHPYPQTPVLEEFFTKGTSFLTTY